MGVFPHNARAEGIDLPPPAVLCEDGDLPRKRERWRKPAATPRSSRPTLDVSAHARNVPPVFFVTSATILAATASISSSVMVFSRGCIVTAIAIDFLASSMPLPS